MTSARNVNQEVMMMPYPKFQTMPSHLPVPIMAEL